MPPILRGVANALSRSHYRILLGLLVISLPLVWGAVWGSWSTREKNSERYIPPPRGWYWVDGRMTLRAFFEKEGIDPLSVSGLFECDGAIDDFNGPSSDFGKYLSKRPLGKKFEDWSKTSYYWDAFAWEWGLASGGLRDGSRVADIRGFVLVRFKGDKWPTGYINGFPIERGYDQYYGCSWYRPPENSGVWAEIDSRYGAVYGVVYRSHHADPDDKVFTVRARDASAWAKSMAEQLGAVHCSQWPDIFRYYESLVPSTCPADLGVAPDSELNFRFQDATRTAEIRIACKRHLGGYRASFTLNEDNTEVRVWIPQVNY